MNNSTISLQGVTTALITPFNRSEGVDLTAMKETVRAQIEAGVTAILPLGTTGETPTLTKEECDSIVQLCVEESAGRVPVMVGTGTNCTRTTIEATRRAKELGADIALVVTPYYNKPSQAGILRHYQEVCAATDMPVLQYNIVGRCGVNVETSTMVELAKIPQIIGVKEASGDLNQIAEVIERTSVVRDDFQVLSGDDANTLTVMSLGGEGVVSVVSNFVPQKVCALVEAANSGDFAEARRLHFELLPLFRTAFIETNPSPIKYAMKQAGMIPECSVRLPLLELSVKGRAAVDSLLREMGIEANQDK